MNDKIQKIHETEILGKTFQVYGTFEEPLFLAKDVAEWIEYAKTGKGIYDVSRMVDTVDDDEKLVRTMFLSGQNRAVTLLTENGLYEVLFQSRKPIAKAFKKEVKKILNELRKHGVTATPKTLEEALDDPDALIKTLQKLKAERAARQEAERIVEEQKPKALFADAIVASKTAILIGDLAKLLKQNGIEIGQNRLFERLRQDGYLIKAQNSSRNIPTQRAMESGLFEIEESTVEKTNGTVVIYRTPKVTGKGQLFFVKKYLMEDVSVC